MAAHREERVEEEPVPGPVSEADETLPLYFLCAHPSLSPSSAVALTLRAVGGLTTRQIAEAYPVPEATMAQRISRRSGRSPARGWTSRGTSPPCCGSCTWWSTRATPGTSTWSPRPSG